MRRGVDTNVLVYAQFPEYPQHERTRNFLLGQLDDPEVTLFLTPTILHEFVHIVTDGRRFEEPLEMATALSTARTFLGRENVTCIAVDQEALLLAYDLLGRHRLGRKRIADCLLAATLMLHDVPELITSNGRDFEKLEGLRVIDPTRETPNQ